MNYNPINSIQFKVHAYTDKTIIPFLPLTPQWYPEDEHWVCPFREPLSRSVPEERPSPVDDGALCPEVLRIQIPDSGTLAIYCQVVHFDSEGPQFSFDNLLICEVVFLVVKDSILLPAKQVFKLYTEISFSNQTQIQLNLHCYFQLDGTKKNLWNIYKNSRYWGLNVKI